MLLAAAEGLPGNDSYPAGCMLTLASMGESCPGEIPHALKEFRLQLQDMLRSRLADAVHADELSADANVEQLARFFLATYQGISTQARDGATAEELKSIAITAMTAWPPRNRRVGIRRRSGCTKSS